MKVSILIGTRNRLDILLNNIKNISKQLYSNYELIILDDASIIDIGREVKKHFSDKRVDFIRSEKQLGVSGGRRLLMQQATGELLCFLDDDAFFDDEHVLNRFIKIFKSNSNVGIVACKIINYDINKKRLIVPFSKITITRYKNIVNKYQKVSYFLGGCHAIRKSLIGRCGYYADELFFGEEELDFSYRVISSGYTIVYEPAIVVNHYQQPSVVSGYDNNSIELYNHVKNRIYLLYKHIPSKYWFTYIVVWFSKLFFLAIISNSLKSFYNGIIDGLKLIKKHKRIPLQLTAIEYLKNNHGRLWY